MPENNEPQKTKYEILYCDENCSAEDIKKSYQKLILKYHPDKQFSQQEQLLPQNTIDNEKFIKITEAWNILRDPEKRKCYDAELLQSRFNTKPIVYEILTNADFQYDDNLQLKIYKCRCGGFYAMPSEDDLNLNNSINSNNNDEENINYIECTECSLREVRKWKTNKIFITKIYTGHRKVNIYFDFNIVMVFGCGPSEYSYIGEHVYGYIKWFSFTSQVIGFEGAGALERMRCF